MNEACLPLPDTKTQFDDIFRRSNPNGYPNAKLRVYSIKNSIWEAQLGWENELFVIRKCRKYICVGKRKGVGEEGREGTPQMQPASSTF